MAGIAGSLMSGLNLSPAEKAFRPWWDNIEDHLIYTLILVGLICAPSSLIMTSTLDCNLCQGKDCGIEQNFGDETPAYNLLFVRKYCSIVGPLHNFVLYFPYILLFFSALLVMVDRPFVQILYNSFNIDLMYKLLVTDDPYTQHLDKKKEANELESCLYNSSNYYIAYLLRTICSLVVSGVPFGVMIYFYEEFSDDVFVCDVHGRHYECTGHPTSFYKFVLVISLCIIGAYFLINLFNLIWLFFPTINSFCRIMYKFKKNSSSVILQKLYFENKDVKLLLSLLSSSSGISGPLRSLALIEKSLNISLIPAIKDIQEFLTENDLPAVRLRFVIPPSSMLHHVVQLGKYKVAYLVEYADISYTYSQEKFDHDIPDGLDNAKAVVLSTLVGGNIVASHTFHLRAFDTVDRPHIKTIA